MKNPYPLRVLHCVVQMDRGGYETLIMNLLRNIDREKVQFDLISSLPGLYDEEFLSLGGKINRVPFISKIGPAAYAAEIRKIFRSGEDYRIVHSHMDKFSGMIVRESAKCGVPVRIAHSHNTRNEGGILYQIVKNYYGTFVTRYATDLFACSQDAAKWMFGSKAADARIINNGIDLSRFRRDPLLRAEVRAELHLGDSFVVGHVGRFTPQKNHLFLLKVFAEVVRQRPDSKLLLVGDGPLREKAEALAAHLGLADKVVFLGVREDVHSLLQAMDVFAFPSLHEGLGIVLVEAQAAGVPCVVSDTVPKEAFATDGAVKLSLNAPPEEWARRIISTDGLKFSAEGLKAFDIRTIAQNLQEFYLNSLSDGLRPGR